MSTLEAIRLALQSLWANKLRSVLTLLGVVIGVSAVIAVVTFVNGINGYVAEKIFNLGADVFIISKVSPVITNIDQFLEGERRKDLTMEDYDAVHAGCRYCTMTGATATKLDDSSGRGLNQNDLDRRSSVAVIGTDLVENVFPGVDPLNKEIRVDGEIYTVVGVADWSPRQSCRACPVDRGAGHARDGSNGHHSNEEGTAQARPDAQESR